VDGKTKGFIKTKSLGFKEWADGKTKGFIKKARVRALPQATKSLGFKEWADG
jgi:hypothetical protein